MNIQTGNLRNHPHGLIGKRDIAARDREAQVLVTLGEELDARKEIQIAVPGENDFIVVQRLRPGLAEKAALNP